MCSGLIQRVALTALLAVAVLPWLQTAQATPKAPAPASSGAEQHQPQASLLADTLHLRHMARNDMAMALEQKTTASGKAALQELGAMTWPGAIQGLGWPHFFIESLVVLGEVQNTAALSAFYHPWADIFMVMRWTKTGNEWKVDDADWITGDWLRQIGDGPVETKPLWLRGNVKRSEALTLSVAESIQAFEDIFLAGYPVNEWRSLLNLQASGPGALINQNMTAARLNAVLLNQASFNVPMAKNDPIPIAVRNTAQNTIDALEKGRMADISRQANKTQPVHRKALSMIDGGALQALFPVFYIPANAEKKSQGVLYLLSEYHLDFALALHFSARNDHIDALEFIPFAAIVEAAAQNRGE